MDQPTPIKKTERLTNDLYEGTREQLVAAGIVRDDQFPPPDRFGISYSQGKVVHRNPPKDETYLRVECLDGSKCRVYVGLPRSVARERKAAEKAHYRNLVEDGRRKTKAEAAANAARSLKAMPRNKEDFRKQLVGAFRHWAAFGLDYVDGDGTHGFAVEPDAMVAIKMAFDGVVEAIMAARIEKDEAMHIDLVSAYQTAIAAGDPDTASKVAQLTRPNASLLAGEMA